MNISFYDKIQIALHIDRKISDMGICNECLRMKICEDFGSQIKREYGLSKKKPNLDDKYLADVHDLIDCYQPPRIIEEMILDARKQIRIMQMEGK